MMEAPLDALLNFHFLAELASDWKVQPIGSPQEGKDSPGLGSPQTAEDNRSDGGSTEPSQSLKGPSSSSTRPSAMWPAKKMRLEANMKAFLQRHQAHKSTYLRLSRAISFRSPETVS